MSQTIDIAPLTPAARVNIPPAGLRPGMQAPAPAEQMPNYDPDFIQLTERVQEAGILLGRASCRRGDVIRVDRAPANSQGNPSVMTIERARSLMKMGLARPHVGPATRSIAEPTIGETLDSLGGRIEAATDPNPPRAERAVSERQKRGAL